MIEKIILDYLSNELTVPVRMERPDPIIDEFVLVEKTGSSRENYINKATIAIQSYAPSLYDAAYLNELVKQAMDELASINEVSSSRLNSDYNFTDTTTKHYRYQCVYDVVY